MTKTFTFIKAMAVSGCVAIATPAAADNLLFQSPSGNINCIVNQHSAYCVIGDYVPSYTVKPADCDADWQNHFTVGPTGRGSLSCVSDSFGTPKFTLPYGATISYEGFECRSEKVGVTCANRDGGGFIVSRSQQQVF